MEILSPQGTSRTSASGEAIDAITEGPAESAAPVSHFQGNAGMAAGQAFGGPPLKRVQSSSGSSTTTPPSIRQWGRRGDQTDAGRLFPVLGGR